MDKSKVYKMTNEQIAETRYLFDRLSLKSLSYDQSKNLFTAYLNNQSFFNEIDYRLTIQLCKVINIKDLLDMVSYSLKKSEI